MRTPQIRQRDRVETPEYLKATARFIRAAGRRAADADEHELNQLFALQAELDRAFEVAIAGQLQRHSLGWVARARGTSRQAAIKRWGHLLPGRSSAPEPGEPGGAALKVATSDAAELTR